MITVALPVEFSDLSPYASKWCLPTQTERYETRLASTIQEMQELYEAVAPRAEDAIAYCDRFPLDAMPDDARNLLYLVMSLQAVSFAVELWRQPHIPDTGAARLDCLSQPVV